MKVNQPLKLWLEQNALTIFQLLSLAFVPRRTYEDIFHGIRRLSSTKRLFLITELEEFKISDDEEKEYEKEKAEKPATKNDETISIFLTSWWKKNQTLPENDDMLVLSEKNYQDKKVLRQKLLKKYFSAGAGSTKTEPGSSTTHSTSLPLTVKEIEAVLSGDVEQINTYRKKNGDYIKQLVGLLGVFFTDDPKAAYDIIVESEKLFS